jgi:serine/threonine protein kinase
VPGQVYRGVMVDKAPSGAPITEVVAVKRLKSSKSNYPSAEFKVQMEVLPRLHHNNVVGYAGFCMEKGEEILVFEYMLNDSLDKWIFGTHLQRGRILSQLSEYSCEMRCIE